MDTYHIANTRVVVVRANDTLTNLPITPQTQSNILSRLHRLLHRNQNVGGVDVEKGHRNKESQRRKNTNLIALIHIGGNYRINGVRNGQGTRSRNTLHDIDGKLRIH